MKFRWASVLTVGTLLLVLVLAGVRGAATVTETRLVPNDGAIGDLFGGLGVSMSGDTAVIGAPGKDSGTGAAYVFVRSGTTWSQQAKLTASDGAPYDAFGTFSSISENTTLVGAPYGGNGTGAAYVFVRSGTTWSQQAKLTASDAAPFVSFGIYVALDGDTALIGAVYKNNQTEAAYVFVRNGTTWSQQARLTAGDGASGDGFGGSINGDAAVIGAPGKRRGTGAAYVYVRNGTNWSQEAKLTASDGLPGDLFGNRVSLGRDTALVTAPGKDNATGAAYVYVRNGTNWSQEAKLGANDTAAGDAFGLGLSLDGEIAVIGAPGDDDRGTDSGSAYLFVRNGTTWSQKAKLTASDGATGDGFADVGVSVSGDTALIGAPFKDRHTGAAYIYELALHATAPSAPQNLEGTAGDAQVTLTWQAPSSDGGTPITNYRIYRGTESGGEGFVADAGTELTYTDTGLTNGVTYYYEVGAVNAVGESPPSSEVSATPATIPSAPQNLEATSSDRRVDLAWLAPASNGGLPITNYLIYRGTSPGSETQIATLGDVRSYTDVGVTNGLTYYYQVSAVNAVGESPPSSEVSATPVTIPSAPQNLGANPGDVRVVLAWQAPSSDGGSPITNYSVYRGTSSGGETQFKILDEVLSYTDTAVTNGATYYYQVSASTAIAEGPKSDEVAATPAATPSAPAVFPPTAGDAQVALSWLAPSSDGGSPITGYNLYRGTIAAAESLVAELGNVLSYTDAGLTNGVTYYYQVSAVNGAGEGQRSSEVSTMPAPPPDTTKPTVVIVSPTSGATVTSATLTVNGTASDNVAVQKVDLSMDGTNWVTATGTTSWSATVTLQEGSNTIYVRVTDTSGNTQTKTITVILQTPVSVAGLPPVVLIGVAVAIVIGVVAAAEVALTLSRRRAGRKGRP